MEGASLAPVVQYAGKEGVTTLIWDRARGHRGPAYAAVEVRRIEQPPYSPELNPAERVFEYLRAQVEGKVYGTIGARQQAIEAEPKKLPCSRHGEAISRLELDSPSSYWHVSDKHGFSIDDWNNTLMDEVLPPASQPACLRAATTTGSGEAAGVRFCMPDIV